MNKVNFGNSLIVISSIEDDGYDIESFKYLLLEPESDIHKIRENLNEIEKYLNSLIETNNEDELNEYTEYLKNYPEFLNIVDDLKDRMQNFDINIIDYYYESDSDTNKTMYFFNIIGRYTGISCDGDAFFRKTLTMMNLSKYDYNYLSNLEPLNLSIDKELNENITFLDYPDYLKDIIKSLKFSYEDELILMLEEYL